MKKADTTQHIGRHLVALFCTFIVFTLVPIIMVYRYADRSGYTQSGHEYAEMNLFMTAIAVTMIAGLMSLICGAVALSMQLLRNKVRFSRWLPLPIAALSLAVLFVARAMSMPDTAQALLRPMWGCVAFALYWLLLVGLGYGKTRDLENQNNFLDHIAEPARDARGSTEWSE